MAAESSGGSMVISVTSPSPSRGTPFGESPIKLRQLATLLVAAHCPPHRCSLPCSFVSSPLFSDQKIEHRSSDRLAKRMKKDEEGGGQVTLSGLLNFTDGLWSCCGEERIIVFTTNHMDSVDPALVRCGRMDVHVSLGTCGAHALRELVRKYLGVEDQMEEAERCIRAGGGLTPAQLGELMLRNRGDVHLAMKEVVAAMHARMLVVGEYDQEVGSPESVLMAGSPENWGKLTGKKRKEGSVLGRKAKFLVRLKSLTKSDSGRRET